MTSSRPNNFQKGFSLPNFRMNGFLEMKAYPDVQPALEALSATGIRLGFLSNLTKAMMAAKTEDPLRPLSRMRRRRGEKVRLRDLMGEPINRLNLPEGTRR
jgi:hypothetical protein